MSGLRDERMVAADAQRLRDDPALNAVLRDLEDGAVDVAIGDGDPRTRESGRTLALAIRALRLELQNRIETVLLADAANRRARASE